MRLLRQAVFLLGAVVLLAGCAIDNRPFTPPVDKVLQDPMPGQSIVYLLRAPYDDAGLAVYVSGKPVAVLPPSTYTAISLPPGRFTLVTRTTGPFSKDAHAALPLDVELQPDTRRFFHVSGAMVETVRFSGVMPMGQAGVLPLVTLGSETAGGSRSWKEVAELDAQGLMSIGRLVLPE